MFNIDTIWPRLHGHGHTHLASQAKRRLDMHGQAHTCRPGRSQAIDTRNARPRGATNSTKVIA
eukprot:11179516-Lingulodinium_polyedra.AAC.1